jgi:hypothetical protein
LGAGAVPEGRDNLCPRGSEVSEVSTHHSMDRKGKEAVALAQGILSGSSNHSLIEPEKAPKKPTERSLPAAWQAQAPA